MTALDSQYRDQGLVVMAFPCNQFGGQEPKSEGEIKKFAQSKFGADFPMFSKIDVKGPKTHPVYSFVLNAFPGQIRWNFASKFLVGRSGAPVARFDKDASWSDIEAGIVEALKEEPTESKQSSQL
jgi:glutathione peroxidase